MELGLNLGIRTVCPAEAAARRGTPRLEGAQQPVRVRVRF